MRFGLACFAAPGLFVVFIMFRIDRCSGMTGMKYNIACSRHMILSRHGAQVPFRKGLVIDGVPVR